MTDFAIHTTLTIDDFEDIKKILKENLNGLTIDDIKKRVDLYEKIDAVINQFHKEKETL